MGKWIKWLSYALTGVAATFLLLLALWIFEPFDMIEALTEYARPTTVETVRLACAEIEQEPPPDLMRVIETQKNLYRLELQKVHVCKTPQRLPSLERRFPGLPFGEE